MSRNYLSVTDTAKLVRVALKKAFPAVKFSVRSESYSMGASINVSWTDGPTEKEVDVILDGFEGGRFDGMIDLAYSADHWLLPDGTTVEASVYGHSFSNEVFAPDPPVPGAVKVHFSADYVNGHRKHSKALMVMAASVILASDDDRVPDALRATPAADFVVDSAWGPVWSEDLRKTPVNSANGHWRSRDMGDLLNDTMHRMRADGSLAVDDSGYLIDAADAA